MIQFFSLLSILAVSSAYWLRVEWLGGWGWKETRSEEGGVQFHRGSDSGLKCVMAYSHNMARY